jgi:hypothetical protein
MDLTNVYRPADDLYEMPESAAGPSKQKPERVDSLVEQQDHGMDADDSYEWVSDKELDEATLRDNEAEQAYVDVRNEINYGKLSTTSSVELSEPVHRMPTDGVPISRETVERAVQHMHRQQILKQFEVDQRFEDGRLLLTAGGLRVPRGFVWRECCHKLDEITTDMLANRTALLGTLGEVDLTAETCWIDRDTATPSAWKLNWSANVLFDITILMNKRADGHNTSEFSQWLTGFANMYGVFFDEAKLWVEQHPPEIKDVLNMRANLSHQTEWQYEEYSFEKNACLVRCNRIIRDCYRLPPTEGHNPLVALQLPPDLARLFNELKAWYAKGPHGQWYFV